LNNTGSKYGIIIKRDTLSKADISSVVNMLVLKSNDPFPEYYCIEDNPTDNSCKENYFYFPVKQSHQWDESRLCRISLEIQKEKSVNVCIATIDIDGDFCPAIRVKGVKADYLKVVIDIFTARNVTFYKNRDIKSYLSIIVIKSFFNVKEIAPGIFRNLMTDGLFYLTINEMLDWSLFEKLITYQKGTGGFKNFDGAVGYWIGDREYIDFIRIFGNKLTIEQLQEIKHEFTKNLAAWHSNDFLI
ncbi:MAG: hypothetical protein K8R35_00165, partial [Bacteroidales bacterium]|nr:hypothetical protein [Bacteroidales bacterium]